MVGNYKGETTSSWTHDFEGTSWTSLRALQASEDLLRMMDTPEYYGDDKEEHLLVSLSRITFHLKRGKSENWQEFFARWETALRKVREHNYLARGLFGLPADQWPQA